MADVRIITRPLTNWPGQLRTDGQRKPNPFSTTDGQTRELLRREARMLGAREVVLQIAITDSEIRLDGEPYARARATHPGVTVVLPESDQGRISWSTDLYRGGRGPGHGTPLDGWQVNLRAIALSMEALRAADRHGVMQGRQYAGFRELGDGVPMGAGPMTVEQAAAFVAEHSPAAAHAILDGGRVRVMALRFAARRLHPDNGGDPAQFARLQDAREVLEQHG